MGAAGREGQSAADPGARFRIGQGYDIHRLESGRPLVIGGVTIPYDAGPVAHSDGDVLAHAVVDALLGAAGAGDIGGRFPDTDPQYAGLDSQVFVRDCAALVRREGWSIVNVDASVVLEAPKLAPHVDAMRRNLSGALGIEPSQVNVKAKTNERVDAVGAGRAIVCQAVALLARAGPDLEHR